MLTDDAETAAALLAAGADVNATTTKGVTALMRAANKTQGILVNFVNKYGMRVFGPEANIGPTPFPEVLKRRKSA